MTKEVYPNLLSLKLTYEPSGRFTGMQVSGAVSLNVLRQSLVRVRGVL